MILVVILSQAADKDCDVIESSRESEPSVDIVLSLTVAAIFISNMFNYWEFFKP